MRLVLSSPHFPCIGFSLSYSARIDLIIIRPSLPLTLPCLHLIIYVLLSSLCHFSDAWSFLLFQVESSWSYFHHFSRCLFQVARLLVLASVPAFRNSQVLLRRNRFTLASQPTVRLPRERQPRRLSVVTPIPSRNRMSARRDGQL